jgi:hypothetical protein
MRTRLFAPLLLGLGLLAAAAPRGDSCGPYGGRPEFVVKLPGKVERGVISGGSFYAVTSTGRLIAVDLLEQQVKDFGTLNLKLAPLVDVAGVKALVAGEGRLHVVDLAGGKVERSIDVPGAAIGLGFLNNVRAFVRNPKGVAVVDLAEGKTLHTIDLCAKADVSLNPEPHQVASLIECSAGACVQARYKAPGQDLYVTTGLDNTVAVIDPASGKVRDRFQAPDWRVSSLQVGLDKAYVVGLRYGYGIWTNSFGCIDLKTKKFTSLKLTHSTLRPSTIVGGPNGSLFLTADGVALRYDANGQPAGKLALKNGERLVGVWRNQALVATDGSLRVQNLPRPEAPAAAAVPAKP